MGNCQKSPPICRITSTGVIYENNHVSCNQVLCFSQVLDDDEKVLKVKKSSDDEPTNMWTCVDVDADGNIHFKTHVLTRRRRLAKAQEKKAFVIVPVEKQYTTEETKDGWLLVTLQVEADRRNKARQNLHSRSHRWFKNRLLQKGPLQEEKKLFGDVL